MRLELFPAETVSYYDEAEHWRLLRLDAERGPTEDPHLVMTAEGAYEV